MRNSPQGNHPGNGTQSQYHRRQQPHHGYQHQQQISGIKDDFRNYISSCYDHIAHAKRTGLSINYELEFRFGDPLCRAHASGESDHRVETGVRRHIFLRAQERLADYFHRTDVFNDRYTKNHLRYRFAVCGDEYLPLVVIHKRQVSFKLIHGLAVKAVLSDEQVVNNAPFPIQANQIDFTRDKVVHTYLLGGNWCKVELSVVNEQSFEIELEVDPHLINQMRSKADFVSEVLGRVWYIFEIIQNTAAVCCYGEIRRGIASYNQLVHALPDTEVDRRSTTFIGNQAYSLHREYLEALLARRGSEIVITDKLDGVRVLLFFTDRDVWMIGRDLSFTRLLNLNDVPRSAALPDLRGTLLDCELMTTTKPWPASIEHRVHVFDVLFFKRDDLRDSKQHGLFQRLSTAAHALRQFQHLGIIMKEYYRGKAQIYHRLQRGLHGSQDGYIILDANQPYPPDTSSKHTYKYKPRPTIDFLFGNGVLYVNGNDTLLTWNEPVEYRCPVVNGDIVEAYFDTTVSRWIVYKVRKDKIKPNYIDVAIDVKRCLQEKIDLVEELCSDASPGKPHASNEPTYLDCIIRDHIATGHASEPGKGYRCPDQVTPSDSYVRLMVLTDAQRTLDLCKRFPTKYKLVNGGHGDDEDYDVLREARVSLQCTGPYGTFPLIYQDVAVTAMLDKGFQLEHAHSIIDHDRWLVKYRKQYECMGDDEREFARACLVYVFRRRSTAEDAAWVPVPAKAVALLSVHLVFGKQPKMRKIVADFNDTLSGILLTESPMVIDGPNTNWADVAKKVALDIYIYNDATGGLSVHRSTHSTVSSLGVALYQPAADQVYVVGETNTTPSLGLFRILRSAVKNAPPIVSVAPAIEPPIQIQVQQDEPRDMDMEMDMEVDKPEEPQQPQQEAEPEMAVVIADEEMAKWTLVKLRDFARTHKINLKGSKSKSELLEHIGAHMKKQ